MGHIQRAVSWGKSSSRCNAQCTIPMWVFVEQSDKILNANKLNPYHIPFDLHMCLCLCLHCFITQEPLLVIDTNIPGCTAYNLCCIHLAYIALRVNHVQSPWPCCIHIAFITLHHNNVLPSCLDVSNQSYTKPGHKNGLDKHIEHGANYCGWRWHHCRWSCLSERDWGRCRTDREHDREQRSERGNRRRSASPEICGSKTTGEQWETQKSCSSGFWLQNFGQSCSLFLL